MEAAAATRVPAGAALAVDRQQFAEYITNRIKANPQIEIVRAGSNSNPERCDHDHRHRPADLGSADV